MLQFLKKALSENGEPSSKRLVGFMVSLCLCFILIYICLKYKDYVLHISDTSMVFILVIFGVATLPQIVSLIKGTPPPPDEPKL